MITSDAPQGVDDRETLRARYQAERARRELTLGAIKAHLQEQPSPQSIRSCARRWCSDVMNLAGDVITARQNQSKEHDR